MHVPVTMPLAQGWERIQFVVAGGRHRHKYHAPFQLRLLKWAKGRALLKDKKECL